MVQGSARPLAEQYDLTMLDLDGVVYLGPDPVAGVPAHLAAARDLGSRLAFVTNNAARTPEAVARHLTGLGVPAEAVDVVTSAQAAAHLLARRWRRRSIAVLGAEGLREALVAEGLVPVEVTDAAAAALVSGYGPDVRWREIMSAAVRIRDGLPWVASNTDATLPTAAGAAPGHGVLVQTLAQFCGVEPEVAGKPARPLLDEAIRRTGARQPLMVGDRLDTDIEGAHAAGVDSLLVLTGVSGLVDLVAAPPARRPTYLGPDLSALLSPRPQPERGPGGWHAGGWCATVDSGRLAVSGSGSASDWWPAVASAAWEWLDEHRAPADVGGIESPLPGIGPSGR